MVPTFKEPMKSLRGKTKSQLDIVLEKENIDYFTKFRELFKQCMKLYNESLDVGQIDCDN